MDVKVKAQLITFEFYYTCIILFNSREAIAAIIGVIVVFFNCREAKAAIIRDIVFF